MELEQKNQTIDLSAIFLEIKNHWVWFLISFLVCGLLGMGYMRTKRPVFDTRGKMYISSESGGAGSVGKSILSSLSILGESAGDIEDEIYVISSHWNVVDAARNLKLNRIYYEKTGFLKKARRYNNSPIEISAPDAWMDTLSTSMKFKIKVHENGTADIKVTRGWFTTYADLENQALPTEVATPYGKVKLVKTKFFKEGKATEITATITSYDQFVENIFEYLTISTASKKTATVVFQMRSPDVQMSKDLINELMRLYNIRGLTVKNEIASKTNEFLNERLNVLHDALSSSENNIQNFKNQNNIVDLEAEAEYQLKKKGTLEPKIIETQSQLAILEMTRDFLARPGNEYLMIPFASSTSSEASNTAIQSYNELVLKYIQLKDNARQDNIALRNISEQIDAMRANVKETVNRSISHTRVVLNDLLASSRENDSRLNRLPAQEREFIDLKRMQVVQNELYSFLLQRKEENELMLAASIPKGQVVDAAYSSTRPIAPKLTIVMLAVLLSSFFIPLLMLYVKSLFKTKFASIEQLKTLTGLPILGEICHNRHGGNIVVTSGKTTSITELFRLVRNNVQFMLPNPDDKVILVTSSISGEGKSFISVNMSASLALLDDRRVILIGADVRAPKLAEYLGISAHLGLTNYLSSAEVGIDDIINHTEVADLDVIVSGPVPPNPAEMLLSKHMDTLIEELRKRYDYIVIDSAPIAMVSDSFSLSRFANLTAYVTRANYTKKHYISYLNDEANSGRLVKPAVILNDTDRKVSYGYGYGYGAREED